MPTPTVIGDLNTVIANNFPAGSNAPSVLDDVQRAHAAFIAQLRDRTATDWPNTPAAGVTETTVQGAINGLETRTYKKNNILGTVSQAAGVPTGAVIERGSNANGEYVRWADGTQMCWHTLPTFAVAANAGTTATWTFPVAFSVAPAVPAWSGSETVTGDIYGFVANAGITTTTAVQKFRNGGTAQDVASTRTLAVGRWF